MVRGEGENNLESEHDYEAWKYQQAKFLENREFDKLDLSNLIMKHVT